MICPLFCLSLAKTGACGKGKREGDDYTSVHQPLVNDQRPMRTPEGRPNNIEVGSLKPVPEMRAAGWSIKKPESHAIQVARTPREGEPTAKNPSEQQARERLSKPPPEEATSKPQAQGNQAIVRRSEASPAQLQTSELRTPEVDKLASRMLFPYMLFEGINDAEYNHAVEVLIKHALEIYPGLTTEEAMKRLYDDTQDSLSFA
jgi:hypothetical protein